MAFIHGKGSVVTIDGDDMSVFSTNVEWKRTSDKHDVTTFGKQAHVYQGGLLDGTGTVQGIYDDGATGPRAVIEPLLGTVVEMVWRPEGTGSGKPGDTVDVLIESYTETSPVADMITFSVEVQMSDAVVTADQGA